MVTSFIRQANDYDDEWMNFSKIEVTYVDNKLESFTYSEASFDGQTFSNVFRAEYEYHPFNSFVAPARVRLFEWSEDAQTWIPEAIISFLFENEIFQGITEEIWMGDDWMYDLRISVAHNEDNKLMFVEEYASYSGDWIPDYMVVFDVLYEPNDLLKIISVFLGDMGRDMDGNFIPSDMTEFQWFHEVLAPNHFEWLHLTEFEWDGDEWIKALEIQTVTTTLDYLTNMDEAVKIEIIGHYYFENEALPVLNFTFYYHPNTFKPIQTHSNRRTLL